MESKLYDTLIKQLLRVIVAFCFSDQLRWMDCVFDINEVTIGKKSAYCVLTYDEPRSTLVTSIPSFICLCTNAE